MPEGGSKRDRLQGRVLPLSRSVFQRLTPISPTPNQGRVLPGVMRHVRWSRVLGPSRWATPHSAVGSLAQSGAHSHPHATGIHTTQVVHVTAAGSQCGRAAGSASDPTTRCASSAERGRAPSRRTRGRSASRTTACHMGSTCRSRHASCTAQARNRSSQLQYTLYSYRLQSCTVQMLYASIPP